MFTGLATYGENPQAAEWLDIFRNQKIENQLAPVFEENLQGGGSREGTYYGVSMRHLFEMYKWWEISTGEQIYDLAGSHTEYSLLNNLHYIVPTMDRLTFDGDQPESAVPLFTISTASICWSWSIYWKERASARSVNIF